MYKASNHRNLLLVKVRGKFNIVEDVPLFSISLVYICKVRLKKCKAMNDITSTEPDDLLWSIEKIVELSEQSQLRDKFYEQVKPHIDIVASQLHLSDMAAIFFSIFVNNYNSSYTSVNDLSDHFKCRNIRIMRYSDSLRELEKKRLVRCRRRDNRVEYRVPNEVIFALTEGRTSEVCQNTSVSQDNFFSSVSKLFKERNEDEILYSDMANELFELLDANLNLELCKTIRNKDLADYEKVLLIYLSHILVNYDEDVVDISDLESIFETGLFGTIKMSLRMGNNTMLEERWLENVCCEGFVDSNNYQITDKAKKDLIGEGILKESKPKLNKDIIQHSSIIKKDLFFDNSVKEQIDKLTELLKPDNFAAVQKRLSDYGMRNGFACLFYGLPGTGKTETVYQAARKTGRDILFVNVSEIKSAWVGETEKNIKKLFEDYRECVSKSESAPILLFNEADAILGTRMETKRSVDKMENTMQNIILQEMENLNGIMIATTNLTINLDKAFERRFIYKIEFQKPSIESKKQIWRSMLPDMPYSDITQLAIMFDFSGGQIENIVRKSTVEHVLTGGHPSLETILAFCRIERLNPVDCRPRIGYV